MKAKELLHTVDFQTMSRTVGQPMKKICPIISEEEDLSDIFHSDLCRRLSGEMEVIMAHLKNIDHEKIVKLQDQVQVAPGQVVSKTLVQNRSVSVTLFAFAQGEEISTHQSEGDALVSVFEGIGRFTVNGKEHLLSPGDSLVMPAGLPHAIFAEQDFKWMLTVVF